MGVYYFIYSIDPYTTAIHTPEMEKYEQVY